MLVIGTVGYKHLDHKINEAIMKELQIQQITGFIGQERGNRKECAHWLTKTTSKYQPKRKIDLGGPLKQWTTSILQYLQRFSTGLMLERIMIM
jgi:hypothetical protein